MVLVTGGLGYIGSHSVISLINSGFEVIIVDDLSNSSLSVLDNINKITGKSIIFEKLNLCNGTLVNNLFDKYPKIDCIMHFAAFKSVSENLITESGDRIIPEPLNGQFTLESGTDIEKFQSFSFNFLSLIY